MLLLVAFLALNAATIARMPIPWGDEVMLTDPVANWYYGRGFVSGTWNIQRSDELFAGYPPLYHLVLMGWVSAFGFGPVIVRSLDVVLAAVLGLMLWLVSWRFEIVTSARRRLLFVGAALGGYGIFVAYRSARPDCVGMVVCAASLLTSRHRGSLRAPALFLLGMLLPLAGLQTLAYAAVIYALLLAFWPREACAAALPQGLGALLGVGLLVGAYAALGVLGDFLAQTVGWQTALGRAGVYDLRHRLGALRDPSTLVAFASLLVVAAIQWRSRTLQARSPAVLGLVVGVVVPVTLFGLAKIPIYYAWMTYLPMLLCLAAALDRPLALEGRWRSAATLWGVFAYGVCVVTPVLFTIVAFLQWHQRDPRRIDAAIAAVVRPDDRAFIEPPAFYACAGRIAAIYDDHYAFSEDEARAVTVLIVDPGHAGEYQKKLGGRWTDTGAELVTRDEPPQFPLITYILLPTPNFRVYRRAD
jgi:hypothetical protein